MPFEARYPGVCPSCEETIRRGDQVAWAWGRDERVVIHDECHALPKRPAEVCTKCWLEKPCPCEDGL